VGNLTRDGLVLYTDSGDGKPDAEDADTGVCLFLSIHGLGLRPGGDVAMANDSAGLVALVTGAGAPRIGNCVARALAKRGYRLAIHANNSMVGAQATADDLRAQGIDAIPLHADLRDESAVRSLVANTLAHFGRIDALVNCAAIWERKSLEEVTADDVRRHFEANVLSTFLCCQHVGLAMVRQTEGGTIVNLGDWAIARPYAHYAAYFPSKGAIPALTRAFAVELARRSPRVRVNAILPGPVMLPEHLSAQERRTAIAGTLLKREGSPQNVADAVVFLLENDFVTGTCLTVDGGRSITPCEL
jgi:pteridine reductase